MRIKFRGLFIGFALLVGAHQAAAQGATAFTYQGQLHDTGTNANGNYAMIFALYDAPAGGNQIGGSVTNLVTLANGLFTANLDFGAGAFDGPARWLEIKVGFTNGGNFVTSAETLSPRVPVLPAPYALYAGTAGSAGQLTNSSWNAAVGNYQSYNNVLGIYASNTLVLGLSPNGVLVNGDLQANHLNAAGLGLDGNLDLGTNTIFLGDGNGGASMSFDGQMGVNVGGNLDVQNSLQFENNGGNLQGDGQGGVQTSGNFTLLGTKLSFPVQSGASLTVAANADFVFNNNIKIGSTGVLHLPGPGGTGSDLSGSVNGLLVNSGAQVTGNVSFNNSLTVTADIHCNGLIYGTVANSSDRNLKEGITPVNDEDILARVASLAITRWNYKADAATSHIGPMAQDFYSAFHVGADDKHITTVDEGGVALAAIQGLNTKLKEKDAQIDALAKRLAELEKLVKAPATNQ